MIKKLQFKRAIFLGLLLVSAFNTFSQEWTWMKGPNTFNGFGNYGTQGVAAGSNLPGARECPLTWTDNTGNLWMFGGRGHCSFTYGLLSDLWKYDVSTNNWTWVNGVNNVNQWGVYGTLGSPNSANTPGSRAFSTTWTDASGNFWLFGGYGYDAFGNLEVLNDLWKYNTGTNQWTWVSGSNATAQVGLYGTLGVASSTNIPGGRHLHHSWLDNSGNMWLIGGYGYGSSGGQGILSDLWKYDPSGNTWTCFKGSTSTGGAGVYGTQGTAATANVPGARYSPNTWKDNSGNLCMFGGWGFDVSGTVGYLNDVWKYNIASNQWTWIKGSNTYNSPAVYGTFSVPSSTITPGGRHVASSWSDNQGNFYVQGGYGVNTYTPSGQNLNDVWKLDVSTNNWTWIRGQGYYEVVGTYGTQGVTDVTTDPGSGHHRASWRDGSGNFWLFGGNAYDVNGNFSINSALYKMNTCVAPAPSNISTFASQNPCTATSATLSAVSNTNTVTWFSTPTGTTSLGTGTTYVTTSLNSGTATTASFTYYASATNTCGTSLVRTPVVVTSNSIFPNVTTGPTQFTVTHYIGNGQTNVSDWSPWNHTFADPLPGGAIITGVDLICDGVDQGWGGSGASADMRLAGTRVGLTQFSHSMQSFNVGNTDPFAGYVYGGNNTFQMYFVGYPGWQGFMYNATLIFRYQTKTPATITACQNSSITLKAYGATSYSWSGGAVDNVPHVLTGTQVYTVTGYNVYGCSNTATQQVNATPAPTVAVSGSTAMCFGSTAVQTATGANTYSWSTGATTSTISLAATGTSTFGVIGTNTTTGCFTPVTKTIVVNPLPVINVNSGTICSGKTFTIVPSGASTYTYAGGSNLVTPITTTNYTVSGTSAAGCLATTPATANVVVNTSPTVSVNSGAICAGNSFTMVPSGAFAYTISGGASIVSPGANTSYSVTGQSSLGCLSTNTAVASLTVNPLPPLSISGPTGVCSGSSISQTVTGANSYSWSTGSTATNISVSPTVNTTYLVSGTTAATGCTTTISRMITVGYAPVITVNSGNVCAGSVFTMVPGGAATYTFSNGSNTVIPTGNTSYFVSGTSALGCPSTASAVANVIVNPAPIVVVNSGTVCAGKVFTMVPSGASSYTFSIGSATVIPTANTSYSVTGTSNLGCISATPGIASVTVSALPVITATNGGVCAGSVFTIVPGGASTYSYFATTGTVSSQVSPSSNTNYSVTGTSAAGCVGTNTAVLTVSIIPLPTISVNSATLCYGKTFTMTASGASTYTYSNGSSTVVPFFNGSYSVTGTSSAGCVSAAPAIASVTLIANPVVSVNSGTICAGKIFTIVPSGASTYTVAGGSNTVSPLTTTSYSIAGTSAVGCLSSNTVMATVMVNPLPSISVIGNSVICTGEGSNLIAVGANSYTWSTLATGQTLNVTPSVTTVYTVTGVDGNLCVNTGMIQILVNPLPVLSLNSGTVCPSGSFAIVPTGAATYTYSGGSSIVTPSVTTSYSVTGTDINGCTSVLPAVTTVTVVNTITLSVSGTTLVCAGSPATVVATGATTYTWNTGDLTGTVNLTPTVTSVYTVTGANGTCIDSAFISITVNSLPSVAISPSSTFMCVGETVTLSATGAGMYAWDGGDSTAMIVVSPSVTTSYSVTGTDLNGCSNKAVLTQTVSDCTGVEQPAVGGMLVNLFPNPNTGNFFIESPVKMELRILNSLGQIVFEAALLPGKNAVDLNTQAKGVYFVQLKQDRQSKTIKLIKD